MLALVKTTPGPGLSLEEVPDPVPGINDVLVRVHKTGICGTDLHIESWDPWAARTIKPPLVTGHEFVGEIVEVGSNVMDFRPGDTVSGEGHVTCGRCRHCMAGRRHLCASTVGLGVGRDGAFAQYVVLPMTNIWHHWPGIDEEVAAIFDPFGNAVHTALAFQVLGEDARCHGQSVLAWHRRQGDPGGDDLGTGLAEPHHGHPVLQVLDALAREDHDAHAVQGSRTIHHFATHRRPRLGCRPDHRPVAGSVPPFAMSGVTGLRIRSSQHRTSPPPCAASPPRAAEAPSA